MNFVHDDPEFDALLLIVADRRRLAPGLVEKDYWVTHTLWALQTTGLDVWFKGGTSLSKGFNLIQSARTSRFAVGEKTPGSQRALFASRRTFCATVSKTFFHPRNSSGSIEPTGIAS
jgi:hypothetical protein